MSSWLDDDNDDGDDTKYPKISICPTCNTSSLKIYSDGAGYCNNCKKAFYSVGNEDRTQTGDNGEHKKDNNQIPIRMRFEKTGWYYINLLSGLAIVTLMIISLILLVVPILIPLNLIPIGDNIDETFRNIRVCVSLWLILWILYISSAIMLFREIFE